jgi:hypothetical protein
MVRQYLAVEAFRAVNREVAFAAGASTRRAPRNTQLIEIKVGTLADPHASDR